MEKLISRRLFIRTALIGIIAVGGAQLIIKPFLRPIYQKHLEHNQQSRLIGYLRRKLKGFDYDEKELVEFVVDYFQHIGSPYWNPYVSEDDVLITYILSTDHFYNSGDESKSIKYLGLNDPYIRVCNDPFFDERLA